MYLLFFILELRIKNGVMILKLQDILFLLKLISYGKKAWSFNKIAVALGMSPSEVHAVESKFRNNVIN